MHHLHRVKKPTYLPVSRTTTKHTLAHGMLAQPSLGWVGLGWVGLGWLDLARLGFGLARLGSAWLGLAWLGLAWLGSAYLGKLLFFPTLVLLFCCFPLSLLPSFLQPLVINERGESEWQERDEMT